MIDKYLHEVEANTKKLDRIADDLTEALRKIKADNMKRQQKYHEIDVRVNEALAKSRELLKELRGE